MDDKEQDIIDVVDEFVDALDPPRVFSEAERLGITTDWLLVRIGEETKTRIWQEQE